MYLDAGQYYGDSFQANLKQEKRFKYTEKDFAAFVDEVFVALLRNPNLKLLQAAALTQMRRRFDARDLQANAQALQERAYEAGRKVEASGWKDPEV
jgi:hypothetical protein